jgi:vanillate monooxygenase ferredoxin subunit
MMCREDDNIVRMDLVPAGASRLPRFAAGAHIDVLIRPGLQRSYSLCNAPDDLDRYSIAVQLARLSRGGSATLFEKRQVGDLIEISAPINNIRLVSARKSIFLVKGIGAAAALGMAHVLNRSGADFEVHYFAPSAQHAPLLSSLMHFRRDGVPPLRIHDHEVESGDVPVDIATILGAPDATVHAFICGAASFVSEVGGAAIRAGWSGNNLHKECFTPAKEACAGNRAFRVKIASTGRVYWIPGDKSIIEVLRDHGLDMPLSCGDGVCGTCATGVLGGTVEHRDYFLTSRERGRNDRCMPCCSRALTDMLVLDL